jgi:hypothetical protein
MTRSAHADNAAYIAASGTATREASSLSVYAGYQKQLELMGMPRSEGPDIRWLIDPTDYLRPIVFDTNDKDPSTLCFAATAVVRRREREPTLILGVGQTLSPPVRSRPLFRGRTSALGGGFN